MSTVLSFGEILWDLFPDYKKPGGSPSNVAYHLHALGNNSHLISKVGSDEYGDELLEFMKDKGLIPNHIQKDQNKPTGTVSVKFIHNEPIYNIHEPAAWDHIEWNSSIEKLSTEADAICYASLSQRNKISAKTLRRIISFSKPTCLKVFDLNLRKPFYQKELILKNIKLANVIKFNEDEFQEVSEWLNVPDLSDYLLREDPQKIILTTLGAQGSKMITSENEYTAKALPISNTGDFVGVGDAFLACVTHLLLQNESLDKILHKANKYAAYVASQKGGMPNIPSGII